MKSTLNERQQSIVNRVEAGEGTIEELIENRESRIYEIQATQRLIAAQKNAPVLGVDYSKRLAQQQSMVDDISAAIDYLFDKTKTVAESLTEQSGTMEIKEAYNNRFDNVVVERKQNGWFVNYDILPEHNRIDGQFTHGAPVFFYSVDEALNYLSVVSGMLGK